MTIQTHKRHIDDLVTVLPAVLSKKNESGVDTVQDLTGLTVEFKMVNEYGEEVQAKTATGVTVTDAANGKVQYDFSSGSVDEAGTYYGYFVVTISGEFDTYPAVRGELVILIYAD